MFDLSQSAFSPRWFALPQGSGTPSGVRSRHELWTPELGAFFMWIPHLPSLAGEPLGGGVRREVGLGKCFKQIR